MPPLSSGGYLAQRIEPTSALLSFYLDIYIYSEKRDKCRLHLDNALYYYCSWKSVFYTEFRFRHYPLLLFVSASLFGRTTATQLGLEPNSAVSRTPNEILPRRSSANRTDKEDRDHHWPYDVQTQIEWCCLQY